MDDQTAALLHHLTRDVAPVNRRLLCLEMERLGAVVEEIPPAPQWEWSDALDDLIADGRVTAAGDRVAINRERIVQDVQQSETQGMLF